VGPPQRRRVAVGLWGCDHLGAMASAGPDMIFDDDTLADLRGQRLRDQPRRNVGRSARRERHDDLDEAIRIMIGVSLLNQERRQQNEEAEPAGDKDPTKPETGHLPPVQCDLQKSVRHLFRYGGYLRRRATTS